MCFSLHPHQRQVKGVSETSGDEAQGALTNVSFFLTKFFSILFGNNDTYITAYGNYLVSEVTKMRFWFYSSLLYVQCVILIKSKKCFILIFFCLLGFIFLLMLYAWTMLVLRFHSPALLFLPKLHCITLITKKNTFFISFFLALEYSVLVQPIRRVSVSLFPDGCNTIRANSDTLSDTWIHKPHHPLKNLGGTLCLVVLEFPFYLVST